MSNNVTEKKWWQSAVVYQIYPKSFQDSNGDGVGDLRGIMERLEYLGKLGIDAIWLSPVCKSPQADNGYDISDYQDIDPMFGSVEDMEALIKEAKKYNIRIIMDLVLNHTSNKHRWFEEAKKSKDNPYHDYYVWRDGEEGVEPNDMKAVFGGSAWEWVPEIKQYYFHQFLPEQPDLNWENPQVRKEIYDMILWWMEKGVGGFRLDVIDQIAKEPDKKITINGPRLHEYFREMSKETFQKGDLITVGEAWGADPERAKLYSNPDGSEFSMVFQFEHVEIGGGDYGKWTTERYDFKEFKKIMIKWQEEENRLKNVLADFERQGYRMKNGGYVDKRISFYSILCAVISLLFACFMCYLWTDAAKDRDNYKQYYEYYQEQAREQKGNK